MSAIVAAIDLGATSGRVILGGLENGKLRMNHVARFPNQPLQIHEGDRQALHWNIAELFQRAKEGLISGFSQNQGIASIGVDSWAVDYALLRKSRMLGIPYHYRDARSTNAVGIVHRVVSSEKLYERNGLQHLDFNTLFQLVDERDEGVLDFAERILMIPDLFNYWLTGKQVAESTNASTTGLLDARTGTWDTELMELLDIPSNLFPPVVESGHLVGNLIPEVATELGASPNIPVISVGSHDTASAVVAMPATDSGAAFISSGTWSLVGIELDSPVLSRASYEANFTNERGVDGTTRFLKNVSGMWLLSESMRTWKESGEAGLEKLLRASAAMDTDIAIFDVMDPRFAEPGDIPTRICKWFEERGLRPPSSRPELVRSILESLAEAYKNALEQAESLTGVEVRTIHIVGGGSQNELLCQLTANRTGKTVFAGPVEATAMGNMLVQLRAVGEILGGLDEMRTVVSNTVKPKKYVPQPAHKSTLLHSTAKEPQSRAS
ncbi:rhamnulokinase family protein [Corynebacterium sp. J010B-136]|uniref:rhamnulokinase n=1 Tax=Corynebacterium sp. J010B-136 TaxID=2099401 RepID=UPI000CFA342D|nr:rhamnulokinase family protein [Corynebacterium sp. J010B-136]PQM74791.1 rhamnulokinase [Corynebacterium sp. J010B-136]